jgi:hypothetical protein
MGIFYTSKGTLMIIFIIFGLRQMPFKIQNPSFEFVFLETILVLPKILEKCPKCGEPNRDLTNIFSGIFWNHLSALINYKAEIIL